jgi:CIC family chloride channel protein
LRPEKVKALIPVGAAAAIAAAFNTPMAAVLFALEEVMGDMNAPILGSVVIASATSWAVLRLMLGNNPLFQVPQYTLVHPLEFGIYALLGIAGGFLSVAFTKLLLGMRKFFLHLPRSTQWWHPVVGGITVGLMGWFVPQVLGVGYGFVDQALNGKMLITTMALLVGLKVIATATCYASGNAGGIFGPSLFMGAMAGGAVGGVAHWLMPDYTGSVGAYALVGMGAAFAGTVRVPLTSVIMIFEITRDYSIIVPLMIANLLSYFISSRLQEEPIYEALQHQDGIHLPSGARAREDLITVALALKTDEHALPATLSVAQALASVGGERTVWPVTDENGLRGMIAKDQLEAAAAGGFGEQALGDLVPDPGPIENLNEARFPHVHPDHSLQSAMQRLTQSGLAELPVVSRGNIRELRGTISAKDVLDAFALGRPATAVAAETKASRKLFVGVVGALVALALLMGFLNYLFRLERTNRADSYYRAAQELMQRGSYEEAIERYRDALSASHSVDYRLALGLALVKAGHTTEAPIYLDEVLREKPGNGPANLGLARAAAQEGRIDDAVSHYQRAIYGSWPEKTNENQFQARIELIDALAKAGRRQQAQGELLSTTAAIPGNNDSLKKQVAQMLIDYGLPKAAENLFREVSQRNKQDAGALEGLADAEFANGEYASARDAYRGSLALDPANTATAKRADLCERILALDPDLRGLGAAQHYERSLKILTGVVDELARCGGGGDSGALQQAQAALARKKRPTSYSDAADSDRALALQLWGVRPPSCAGPGADDALSRVMAQLTPK